MKFKRYQLIGSLLGAIILSSPACQSKTSTTSDAAGASSSVQDATIAGQLAIDVTASAGSPGPGVQTVQLVNDSEKVFGETKTTEAGAFVIDLNAGASLTASESGTIPKFLYVKSLFIAPDKTKKTAVGVRDAIVLDGRDMAPGAGGKPELNTGTHVAQKVGAIYGKISLETGESPVGIDVYVPGTTHIAKTDETGVFLLGFLPKGTYNLRAEKDGFSSKQWDSVVVKTDETTDVGEFSLTISTGPKVESFTLQSLDANTGKIEVSFRLSKASKFRVSKFANFSDTVYKPYSATNDEVTIPLELNTGAKVATIYIEAADSDGLAANSSITIDQEAPTEGSINVKAKNKMVNSSSVALTLSAQGATKMRIAESAAGLASGDWITYTPNYTYKLSNKTEGARRLYVAFTDDGGNILGSSGEISVGYTLDTSAPMAKQLTLLTPASPTANLDASLGWTSAAGDSGLSYLVEVYSDSAYTDLVTSMTTTETAVSIDPPLPSPGNTPKTYYWRIKAIDAAGNESEWVTSGSEKSFTVKSLASSWQPVASYAANELENTSPVNYWGGGGYYDPNSQQYEHYFGKEIVPIGDLTGDGISEIAFSVMKTSYTDANGVTCNNCGVVRILNPVTREVVATLGEGLPFEYGYGHRIIGCDLDHSGHNSIVVSAPSEPLNNDSGNNGYYYSSGGGAIYVYTPAAIGEHPRFTSVIRKAPSYSDCSQGNGNGCNNWNNMGGSEWGTSGNMWGWRFGWDIECLSRTSSASAILVAEPGFSDTNVRGRIYQYELDGSTLSSSATINGPVPDMDWQDESFASVIRYLPQFGYNDSAEGSGCHTSGGTLIVGSPSRYVNGMRRGGVSLYRLASTHTWSKCTGTIPIQASDNDPWGEFGRNISKLGDINRDNYDEIALNISGWANGSTQSTLRIYGGSSGNKIKEKTLNGDDYMNFGAIAVTVGDFTGDKNQSASPKPPADIAIAAPSAKVNGRWTAGYVEIFGWGSSESQDLGASLLQITGQPTDQGSFGSRIVPVFPSGSSSLAAKPDFILISKPGERVGSTPTNAAMYAGGAMWGTSDTGAFFEFRKSSLAPGESFKIVGEFTEARLGSSIAAVPDQDGDKIDDFVFAQPGAYCDGLPYGALSLYSPRDRIMPYCIPGSGTYTKLGQVMSYLPSAKVLMYSALNAGNAQLFTLPIDNVFSASSANFGFNGSISVNSDRPFISASESTSNSSDLIVSGNYKGANSVGSVVSKTISSSGQFNGGCTLSQTSPETTMGQTNGYFGSSASLIADISNSTGEFDIVVGAPNEAADLGIATLTAPTPSPTPYPTPPYTEPSSTPTPDPTPTPTPTANPSPAPNGDGAVYIMEANGCTNNKIIYRLTKNDTSLAGVTVEKGFGSFVMGLPKYGSTFTKKSGTSSVTISDVKAFFYVANTNLSYGPTDGVPQYFIFALYQDWDRYRVALVRTETGTAGSMLGGYAKVIESVDSDSAKDIMIAHPGGTSVWGNTGQVKILSGAQLTSNVDPTQHVLLVIYNPDPQNSLFGSALEFADATGDGVRDILIGASKYSTDTRQHVGAVYVFPLEATKTEH